MARYFTRDKSGEVSVIETDKSGTVIAASKSLHYETVASLADGENDDLLNGLELDEAQADWYNTNRAQWNYFDPATD